MLISALVCVLTAWPAMAQETFYSSDFEVDDGGWASTNEWEWGAVSTTPTELDCSTTATFPPGANSGDNAWATDLDDCHDASLTSVLSQTFDLTAVSGNVMFCWSEWVDSGGNTFDMALVHANGDQLYLSSGTEHAWIEQCVNLDAYSGMASVTMDFTFIATTVVERAGWYIDDVSITADVIPVELTSFTGQSNGLNAVLAWETASETNNAGFEVQMDAGAGWQALGFVDGHGTTTEAQSYSYSTGELDPGTYTFRLKQIDFDGAFEYHGNVEVTIETPGTHTLSDVYPNPFNPTAQFALSVAREQNVDIALYNILGQQVATLFSGTVEANQTRTFTIDGNGLPSGAYLVRVVGEQFTETARITLLK